MKHLLFCFKQYLFCVPRTQWMQCLLPLHSVMSSSAPAAPPPLWTGGKVCSFHHNFLFVSSLILHLRLRRQSPSRLESLVSPNFATNLDWMCWLCKSLRTECVNCSVERFDIKFTWLAGRITSDMQSSKRGKGGRGKNTQKLSVDVHTKVVYLFHVSNRDTNTNHHKSPENLSLTHTHQD